MTVRLIATLAALVLAPAARAHEFWIAPSSFRPQTNAAVQLDLRLGDDLPGESFPRKESIIDKFAVWGQAGEPQNIVGRDARSPAGYTKFAAPGEYVIGYRSKPSAVDLDAEKFEKYLKDKGLNKTIAARAAAGQSKANGKEMFSRCAKCIVRTADATEAKGFDRVIGQTLELVPVNDPTKLKAGEPLVVKLLYKDKPAADVLVHGKLLTDQTKTVEARTDKDGRVSLTLPVGGAWLISAVEMVKAPEGIKINDITPDWESLWASLTFQTADAPTTTATEPTKPAPVPSKEAKP